ncbi:MAG: hypothetical protein K1X50_18845 [Candidatus Promineofilum sp.]|nr:hypothetical protein [Promineifilum sp.]
MYLLHFEQPINPTRPARHYLGYADDLGRRIQQHERGIRFKVVRVWRGDRELERRLKGWKQMPRYCPVCGRNHQLRGVEEVPAGEIEEMLLAF